MGNQKRQRFVPGPPKFTKSFSFPSYFRVNRFRSPVSGPPKDPDLQRATAFAWLFFAGELAELCLLDVV